MLLKQHPAAIDKVMETFYLSEGEKRFLLSAGIGEGLFFAGANHVAIKVMASDAENKLITTNPEELLRIRKEREAQQGKLPNQTPPKPVYKPYKAPESMDTYTTFDKGGQVKAEFAPKPKIEEPVKTPTPQIIKPEVKVEQKPVNQPITQSKPQVAPVSEMKNQPKPMPANKTINLKRVDDDDEYINKMPSAGDILDSVEEMRRQKTQQKPASYQNPKPISQQPTPAPKPSDLDLR
jgi:hypothetical protein